jgi:hypothetical protein
VDTCGRQAAGGNSFINPFSPACILTTTKLEYCCSELHDYVMIPFRAIRENLERKTPEYRQKLHLKARG